MWCGTFFVAELTIELQNGGEKMQRARMLGNYAQYLAQKNNVPDNEITTLLDCSAN